jgi:cytochrome c
LPAALRYDRIDASSVVDLAALDRYLTAPQAMVSGTKMTFPGIKNDEQRVAVIAYLETLKP